MPRVLWVEDDKGFLSSVKSRFGKKYDLMTAGNVADGISNLLHSWADTAIVIIDMRMPYFGDGKSGHVDDGGMALIDMAHRLLPDTPVVVVTGFNLSDAERDSLEELDCELIPKSAPGWVEMVNAAIDQAIKTWLESHANDSEAAGLVEMIPAGIDGGQPIVDWEPPAEVIGRIRKDLIKVAKDLEDLESRLGGKGQ